MNSSRQFVQASFVIDSIPETVFDGYIDSAQPRGWSSPYFKRDVAEAILIRSVQVGFRWRYNYESDAYIVTHAAFGEESGPEIFSGVQTQLNGSTVTLYPIGAYLWAWQNCSEYSHSV